MAILTKNIDPSSDPADRSITWTDSDFVVDDILDVENTLKRSAIFLSVDCGSSASITFRVNSLNRRYPTHPDARIHNFSAPDLTQEETWTNPDSYTRTVENGTILELDITVRNIEITALTAGNGITIQVR